jgi:hypothetical protein
MRINQNGKSKMIETQTRSRGGQGGEQGMALVGVMLVMSLMVMLALAVSFTALSDNSITSNFKNTTKGFYAAEAGIHNLQRVLNSNQFLVASLPTPPVVTIGMPSLTQTSFTSAAQTLLGTSEYFPNDSDYKTTVQITGMVMPYPAEDTNPADTGNHVTYLNPLYPALGQSEPYVVNYALTSVGQGIAGLNGTVSLQQTGTINFTLLAVQNPAALRVGTFAEFALFADKFNPYAAPYGAVYQGFGPGDHYSGRVHTNQQFGFWTGAGGQGTPTFNGKVTQVDQDASYYAFGAQQAPPPVDANSEVVNGVVVAPEFLAGFDRGVQAVPPPGNAFNQAEAVLDGGYSLSATPPTDAAMDLALRSVTDLNTALPAPKNPTSTTPDLPPGIYIPTTNGTDLSGSGLYIMGDANQILLSADLGGNQQVIKITQGNQTVTVTIDMDANTTTITNGTTSTTLKGIPLDRSSSTSRPGASLYVYGNIDSLTGPGRDSQGQPIPAIDSDFALTVTAGGYSTGNSANPVAGGNITITGDLTYETPVVDSLGNPINQTATNVLGIYASGGNIQVPVDGRAPNNLTIDGSIAAFTLTDALGNPVVGAGGSTYGGNIQSNLSNWANVGNLGSFTVVGGMQSSNYGNFGLYNGTMHGFAYNGVWDARYDKGQAPPFYPGYVVKAGSAVAPPSVTVEQSTPMVLSYTRVYNGTVTKQ